MVDDQDLHRLIALFELVHGDAPQSDVAAGQELP